MARVSETDEIARRMTHPFSGCAYLDQDYECPWGCVKPTLPEMALRPYSADSVPEHIDLDEKRAEAPRERTTP